VTRWPPWPYWACARCRRLIGKRDPLEASSCVSLVVLARLQGAEFEGERADSVICAGCVTLGEHEALTAIGAGGPA
jgi:hypothetical protein